MDWHHPYLRLSFEMRRMGRYGLTSLFFKAMFRMLSIALWFVLLPLSIVLHVLGFRRVTVFTDRIGHLALEPDCLLKDQELSLIPRRRWFILAPPNRVANGHLLGYWKPMLRIFEGRAVCFVLESMSRWGMMRHDISHYIRAIGKNQAAYRVYKAWGDRPSLLELSAQDRIWGDTMLARLGVPDGAWFACVHAREGGFSPVDEDLHRHRNSDIENTIPAIREIVRRGGWVVRIGDPTMRPLPPMPQVIDYAHHPLKSPRLDVILCARAKFILGNSSGIALVGTVFGVPCALANMVPLAAMGMGAKDISIPKLYCSEIENRYLRFNEVFTSPLSRMQYARAFADSHVRVEESASEDIKDLVAEMLDRLEERDTTDMEGRALQEEFLALISEEHYSFGTISNISARFLIRHRKLMDFTTSTMHDVTGSIT